MDTIKNILDAVAEWFTTGLGAGPALEALGEFVKGLFDTILGEIFPL